MVELKYSKYIVTDYLSKEQILSRGRTPDERKPGVPFANGLLWVDEKIIQGAFYLELVMLEPGAKSTGVWVKPHIHEYDEIIGFVGTNVKKPHDLGGEVELWLDDEKHTLSKTCLVFIPKGLRHCPLVIVKVDTPIVQFSVMTGRQYLWTFV
jgi:quercetin dioxygenase-like cupin family protein